MKTEQEKKLHALLAHAQRSTARYANLLPQFIEPSNPIELLKQLPTLSRQDVHHEKARLYSTAGDTSSWRIARTTGTTGEPVEVILDRRSREVEMRLLEDHFNKYLKTGEWRTRDVVHLVLHTGASSYAAPSPWNLTARVIKWNLLQAWQRSDAQFQEALEHIKGNVITVMPSVAELLCGRLRRMSSYVKPLLILLSGETVEPEITTLAAEVFDCPVTSLYTAAEVGIVGRPCGLADGYHVEERNAFLEILDEDGQPVEVGREGEIVVTALENYAMPLIRYRLGDRGFWREDVCTCGDSSPRFQLTASRRPMHLVTASGVGINVVRFAKMLASFDLKRYSVNQSGDGTVIIDYRADRQLDKAPQSVMKAAMQAAVGPEVSVCIRRVSDPAQLEKEPGGQENGRRPHSGLSLSEPDGPDLADLSRWLQERLAGEEGLETAVLTGSALDPDAATRFSDIDLVLFLQGDVGDPRWGELARRLRLSVPKLAVNIDRLNNLSRRSPLFTCRVLREQLPVIGCIDDGVLDWPSQVDLKREGRMWAQQALAVLWHQLTSPGMKTVDPIREAWVAAKYGLNALRYRYLICGENETAPLTIIARALRDKESLPWLDDLIATFDIAREHRPPPLPTPENIRECFVAAWYCVHSTMTNFLDDN